MFRPIDPGHAGVLHVLTSPLIEARAVRHLDAAGMPDIAGLHEEAKTMSGGEALLVHVASDLWSATRTVGLTDVVRRLDGDSFTRVVQALRLSRLAA